MIAALGAILGSFFYVLILWLPRGKLVLSSLWRCSECGNKLPPSHLIPIYSQLAKTGKCPFCGAVSPRHQLLLEIVTPLLFLALGCVHPPDTLEFWQYLLLFSFLIPIFFLDLWHKIIPLALSLPTLAAGLLLSLVRCGYGWRCFALLYLLPVVGAFALLLILAWAWKRLFQTEGLGGGDIVLIPAVAAWFGAVHTPFVILLSCLLGMAYYLIFIRKPEQPFVLGSFVALAAVLWALAGEALLLVLGILPGMWLN